MSNTLREQYKRELHNWLFTVSQTAQAIQRDQNATLEQKLKALDTIHKQIAAAKKALIYIYNTQPPRDL